MEILLAVGVLAAASAAGIEHKAVACVEAEKFPRFEARLSPPEAVGRARVYFRAEGGPAWYAVAMAREGDVYSTFLASARWA